MIFTKVNYCPDLLSPVKFKFLGGCRLMELTDSIKNILKETSSQLKGAFAKVIFEEVTG